MLKPNKGQRKPKGQSRIDNPETQETLGTRYRAKSNKTENIKHKK